MLKLKTKVSLLGNLVLWLSVPPLPRGHWGWVGGHMWVCGRGEGACSFADVSLHDPLTLPAGDVAAPVVLAMASLH